MSQQVRVQAAITAARTRVMKLIAPPAMRKRASLWFALLQVS
jgi:hypothetical protein